MVGCPFWSVKSGRQPLPECREWSVGPPKVLGVVSSHPEVLGVVGRPCRSVGSGRQALLECRKRSVALPECREWSVGPPKV